MKKLVMTALMCAGLAHLATGCVITTDDDPAGYITVSWSLVSGDANTPVDCPAGASTIAVISEDSFGEQFTDLFDCFNGVGSTADLFEDRYFVWVELQDDTGDVLWAQSLGAEVDVVAGFESTVGFEFSIDRGAFDVAWDVYAGPDQINCEDVGAVSFALDSTDSLQELYVDEFACVDYAGTTAVMPLDDWISSPSILDAGDLAVATGDTIESSLLYGNQYEDLGVVLLDTQAP